MSASVRAGEPGVSRRGTHVAEATDLVVRLALRVKVRTTLSTAHVETGQGVLEHLLEAEELEDGQVDGRVETEATLVRAEDRRELDTVTGVDLALALSEEKGAGVSPVLPDAIPTSPRGDSGISSLLSSRESGRTLSSSQTTRKVMTRSGTFRTVRHDTEARGQRSDCDRRAICDNIEQTHHRRPWRAPGA